ncbi:MAG: phosphoribosyl-ATP diphosphatase [Planctomycetota bacterium]|jgi:phosphoribosyl-ATP pyrophosphohydrolase
MTHVDIFDRLMAQLHQRATELPEGSYTTQLIRGGIPKIAGKIQEETAEVIEAASEPGASGRDHTVREACDVLFHLWVLLAVRGIDVNDLRRELQRREGVSGLQEKANRTQSNEQGNRS